MSIFDFLLGRKPQEIQAAKESSQEFMNLRDIRNQFLYTKDGYVFSYIQVEPISTDLFSETEKVVMANTLTAEFSRETEPYCFHSLDRAIDIKPYILNYKTIRDSTQNAIRKKILADEMDYLGNLAQAGDVLEKVFFFSLWTSYELNAETKLAKRRAEFCKHLQAAKLQYKVLDEAEIRQLCMFYTNPSISHLDDGSFNAATPYIEIMTLEAMDYEK